MKSTLKVLAFTILLPTIAFLSSLGTLSKLTDVVRQQIKRQYPTISDRELKTITIPYLESKHAFSSPMFPDLYANLRIVRDASVATALAAVLTVLQVVEFVYAFYYFESFYSGGVHFQILFLIGLGGVVAVAAVGRAALSLFKVFDMRVVASVATAADQPDLWREVKFVCAQLGSQPPDHIVLGLQPTFFVTESDLICSGSKLSGRTLFVSLTMSRLYTCDELRAVMGHELAHFAGDDTAYSKRFFPIYRGTLTALMNLNSNSRGWMAFASLPARTFIGFFYQAFVRAEKNVSRAREKDADASGARVAGAEVLGRALIKIHAYAPAWKPIFESFSCNNEDFREENNALAVFMRSVSQISSNELSQTGSRQVAHPADSHPTLAERLELLGVDLQQLVLSSSIPSAESCALSLIQGSEILEQRQTGELRHLRRK